MSDSKKTKSARFKDYLTIAFYNLENLFDTVDDIRTNDEGFLPDSERRWTLKRFNKKIRKLGYTISQIGQKSTGMHPIMVGLAEVENENVVEELLKSKFLNEIAYDYVHYDSPDERGIDTAFIYDRNYFELHHSEIFSIELFDEDGMRDHTRDILYVYGHLKGEAIHVLVNHWPSRREGVEESEPKRLIASNKLIEIINGITSDDPDAKIIVMGDFNDDPSCKSIKQLSHYLDLHNPMTSLLSYSRGSLNHKFNWNLFDQILFTTNFFEYVPGKHSFSKVNIFDQQFLKQFRGRHKGNPFRTYVGIKYKGGYSDHFPVYLLLKKV
ncbi:MAG: endonuclease [Flavobacteriaceae bacterium]|nr:endonuclease [Bacteroidia bacterium]MBT8287109.1 endonuclease [Bacteroidia bacterium]NNF73901.1 endonuclease [Flavobacteriaceae bacterium]NNK71873.1 endonuclease [Flavobacteriaceae bacterium]